MATTRRTSSKATRTRQPPATTPEAREQQLISAAVSLAEQQLIDGTASAQVITHYLKLGSTREKLEQLRLENETKLLEARVEALASAQRVEELYAEAISAMRRYSGQDADEDDDYDD